MAKQFGEQADLVGASGAGNGTAWQADFQCGFVRRVGHLGDEEGGLAVGAIRCRTFPRRNPGGKGGILDAALSRKGWRAEAAGLECRENLLFVLRGVAGAAAAVRLDDGAGGLIGDG